MARRLKHAAAEVGAMVAAQRAAARAARAAGAGALLAAGGRGGASSMAVTRSPLSHTSRWDMLGEFLGKFLGEFTHIGEFNPGSSDMADDA